MRTSIKTWRSHRHGRLLKTFYERSDRRLYIGLHNALVGKMLASLWRHRESDYSFAIRGELCLHYPCLRWDNAPFLSAFRRALRAADNQNFWTWWRTKNASCRRHFAPSCYQRSID